MEEKALFRTNSPKIWELQIFAEESPVGITVSQSLIIIFEIINTPTLSIYKLRF